MFFVVYDCKITSIWIYPLKKSFLKKIIVFCGNDSCFLGFLPIPYAITTARSYNSHKPDFPHVRGKFERHDLELHNQRHNVSEQLIFLYFTDDLSSHNSHNGKICKRHRNCIPISEG